MGILNYIKEKFSSKKEVELTIDNTKDTTPQPSQEIKQEDPLNGYVVTGKRTVEKPCEICNKIIGTDRYTKKQGRFFHSKCFRQKENQVKRQGLI